jgi:hypothetical protein
VLACLLLAGCGRIGLDQQGDAGSSPDGRDTVPDVGRTTDASSADAPMPGGLPSLWYRMNEGSGTVIHDEVGGHDAMLTGIYAWTQEGLSFTAGAGQTSMMPAEFRTYPLTVSAWLTPGARADEGASAYGLQPFPPNAVSNDVAGVGGFGMGVNVWTDGTPGSSLRAGWANPTVAATFAAGTRYHVVLAYSASRTVSIYVDGALLATRGTAAADKTLGVLFVGAHNLDTGYASKRFFVGDIDDVRVYTSLLDASSIAALHDAGPL